MLVQVKEDISSEWDLLLKLPYLSFLLLMPKYVYDSYSLAISYIIMTDLPCFLLILCALLKRLVGFIQMNFQSPKIKVSSGVHGAIK